MQLRTIAFIGFILLTCSVGTLAQDVFPTADAFVKATLKGEDRLSVEAKGDLNADGLEDWAGVIHRHEQDAAPTQQLYVLLRLRQGGFQLSQTTQDAEIPGMGCCWLEDLRIARGSLYIQDNAKDASTMEAATHQFKLYPNGWRLIGIRISLTDHTPRAQMTKDTDINLLTGAVIEKTQKRNRKLVVQRRQQKFAVFNLKDFDFSNGFGLE